MMDRVPIGAWGLLFVVLFFGWLWLFYWLRCVCPLAFWCLDLGLLVLSPALWVTWCRLKEEWRRDRQGLASAGVPAEGEYLEGGYLHGSRILYPAGSSILFHGGAGMVSAADVPLSGLEVDKAVKKKLSTWLRWKVIHLMDRFDDTCWAQLVMWYIGPELHPFWEILELRRTAGVCERNGEVAYCGKCVERGYHGKPIPR